MKNKITNLIAGLFMLAMLTITLLACGYAESGNFLKALPYLAIELMACVGVAIIATHNSKKAKKAKEKAKARAKAKELKRAMEEFQAEKAEEAKLSCIRTASTNYCFESPEAYYERIEKAEERALYLASVGLEALI